MEAPVESPHVVPPPLTPRQRRIFFALFAVIALTRFLAIARSLFDWDEALFARAVREFDVVEHGPHPPGYPLFLAAAKLFHLFGVNEFHSLQVVVVLGAIFIFPALFLLARELGFTFTTAATGAALFAFLPNVWIYGGTGFSDVPSTTVAFFACALLLRGRQDTRAYVAGAIVLGIAAGMRMPNLLMGAVPALLATYARLRARAFGAVALAMIAGAAVVAASYGGAALASQSVAGYIHSVRWQTRYVREVDSWRNPGRGPLSHAAVTFLLRPFETEDALNVLAIAGAISLVAALVRRRAAPLLTFLVFAPLGITAWLNLDINTAGRYAIGYMAAHALLSMDGFRVVFRFRAAQIALCVLACAYFAHFTWPALTVQRKTNAPPAAALLWIRRNVLQSTPVYVHGSFDPHAKYYLWDYDVRLFEETVDIPRNAGAWVVHWDTRGATYTFTRPHRSLWDIVRRRGFETSVQHSNALLRYGSGWYPEESSEGKAFRWMRGESETWLPAMHGAGRLTLRMYVPLDALAAPPQIEIRMNGNVVDRFAATTPAIAKTWTVPARGDAVNELRILTSGTMRPANVRHNDDTRELGLRIDELTWTPAR